MSVIQQRFLHACRRQPVDAAPVWFMRQAGRYQPEYRRIRERYSLLEICNRPDVCAEVTRLPVEQLGVDAAILFSDIAVPFGPMGFDYDIKEGIGPVVNNPIRTAADVDAIVRFNPAEGLPYVLDTIGLLREQLAVPLIGFAGAPFTLASYLIEGKPSRDHVKTKEFMWGQPCAWQTLMDKLGDVVITYLTAQVKAGASAVQLFDTWVGCLSPEDFRRFVLPVVQRIFASLKPLGVPLIYFGKDTGELLGQIADSGATVLSIDWRVPLPEARMRTGDKFPLQGNLDPALLFAPWAELEMRTRNVIDAGLEANGYIFNLGWGILHQTPSVDPAILRKLTAFVHEYSAERLATKGN